ncbi:MAG: hypothetical protein R3A44_34530 [Caldilineaceae bacterium]
MVIIPLATPERKYQFCEKSSGFQFGSTDCSDFEDFCSGQDEGEKENGSRKAAKAQRQKRNLAALRLGVIPSSR